MQALEEFKQTLQPLGLLGSYASPDDLAYKVRAAIESDLNRLDLGVVKRRTPAAEHASLRARYESDREQHVDNKGRLSYRTRGHRLTVRNIGSVAATKVRVELHGLGDSQEPPDLRQDEDVAPTLIPDSEFSWPLSVYMGTARAFEVVMTWNEGDEERTEAQHVSA